MKVNHLKTKNDALKKAEEKLFSVLSKYTNENIPVLLLLSGGSAIEIIKEFDWTEIKNVTITTLDERYANDESNNFLSLEKYLPRNIETLPTVPKENEDLETFANRLNKNLKDWLAKYINGKIVATLGIGADGHTAGILPIDDKNIEKKMNDQNVFVIGYKTDKSEHKMRATTNFTFLKKINNAIVFLSGEKNKKTAWEKIIAKSGNKNDTPSRIICEMTGEVSVFMDF